MNNEIKLRLISAVGAFSIPFFPCMAALSILGQISAISVLICLFISLVFSTFLMGILHNELWHKFNPKENNVGLYSIRSYLEPYVNGLKKTDYRVKYSVYMNVGSHIKIVKRGYPFNILKWEDDVMQVCVATSANGRSIPSYDTFEEAKEALEKYLEDRRTSAEKYAKLERESKVGEILYETY